jgi:hypothetical protein
MIVVDLQELEEQARTAIDSIGGVVLEPEALLLIISEIRRMKSELGEQHIHLTDVRGELLQLRTELVDAQARNHADRSAKPKKKGKTLKMRVVKDEGG